MRVELTNRFAEVHTLLQVLRGSNESVWNADPGGGDTLEIADGGGGAPPSR